MCVTESTVSLPLPSAPMITANMTAFYVPLVAGSEQTEIAQHDCLSIPPKLQGRAKEDFIPFLPSPDLVELRGSKNGSNSKKGSKSNSKNGEIRR